MKFILHNLRMIWSRLRSNGWVLAELFLVFIVMWFLCDSLGCLKYTFYRPLGYNIDHVYQLNTIIGGATSDTTLTNADRYLRALQKLEQDVKSIKGIGEKRAEEVMAVIEKQANQKLK